MATPEELHDFILERVSERAARKAAEAIVYGHSEWADIDSATGEDVTVFTVKIVKSGE